MKEATTIIFGYRLDSGTGTGGPCNGDGDGWGHGDGWLWGCGDGWINGDGDSKGDGTDDGDGSGCGYYISVPT